MKKPGWLTAGEMGGWNFNRFTVVGGVKCLAACINILAICKCYRSSASISYRSLGIFFFLNSIISNVVFTIYTK